jgi:hypothetical protein
VLSPKQLIRAFVAEDGIGLLLWAAQVCLSDPRLMLPGDLRAEFSAYLAEQYFAIKVTVLNTFFSSRSGPR